LKIPVPNRRALRDALASIALTVTSAHARHGLTRHDEIDRPARTGDAGAWREVREKLFAAAAVSRMQKARSADGSSGIASVYNGDDAFNGNGENRNTR
jgi:hypothetical protein